MATVLMQNAKKLANGIMLHKGTLMRLACLEEIVTLDVSTMSELLDQNSIVRPPLDQVEIAISRHIKDVISIAHTILF